MRADLAERSELSDLGVGVGLRAAHFPRIVREPPAVDWFELLTENHLYTRGPRREMALWTARRYPVALHGVSLDIGGPDPLDFHYLAEVRRLAEETRARWISDHVCFTSVGGRNSHELLPLPYTESVLRRTCERIDRVQDFLGRPLVLENPSTYVTFRASTMSEPEFLARLCDRTGCALLLDVNNVYVTCFNHDEDPVAYLDAVPWESVVQFHLAGHTDKGDHLLDTHSARTCDAVLDLYEEALRRAGPRSTLIEWDADLPAFEVLEEEVRRAARRRARALEEIPR